MKEKTCSNCGRALPHGPGASDACKRAVRAAQNNRNYFKHRDTILRKRAENPHADVRYRLKQDHTGVLPDTYEGIDGSMEPIEDWIQLLVAHRRLKTALRKARRDA